jgi:sulfotransferase
MKLHYLSGLPRSGNTVLAAILNQHPEIYVSPLSPVGDMMKSVEDSYLRSPDAMRNPDPFALDSVMHGIPQNYYKGIRKPVVIDRNKCWTTPDNIRLIKAYLDPEPKIIITVRDILACLTSFVNHSNMHPWLDKGMEIDNFGPRLYMDRNDAICEYVMRPGGMFDTALRGLKNAIHPDHRQNVHLVDYYDLVQKPHETITKVHEFLGVKDLVPDFTELEKLEEDHEELIGQPPNLHEVRKELKHKPLLINDYLSESIIKRYDSINFWETL